MIAFYDYELSADAYKAKLLMLLLDVPFAATTVDVYPAREDRAEWFLRVNPAGTLPVVVDGATTVAGVQPVLAHLAAAYDRSGRWSPSDPATAGAVAHWLAFADQLAQTAGAARKHDCIFATDVDAPAARERAHALLRELDEALWFAEQTGGGWLVAGDHPTIADIACFPDAMLAEEGGIPLHAYRAVRRWTDRIKALPNFTPMPGMFAL